MADELIGVSVDDPLLSLLMVVLTADSRYELRRTYGRYFRSAAELIRDAFDDDGSASSTHLSAIRLPAAA